MNLQECIKLSNGFDFPLIGLGTYSPNPEEPWVEAVKNAIDIGYRHFDCASLYGNEKQIGEAINQKIAEGVISRGDIFVTSKLWNNKHDKDAVEPALKKTLENLDLEYLDLYLIHWPISVPDIPGENMPKNETGQFLMNEIDYKMTWKGMEDCLDNEYTRSIGLSNFNTTQIRDIIRYARIKPTVLQIECHPYLVQKDLIKFCKGLNIAVTAYCPLGGSGKQVKSTTPKIIDHPVLKALAKKYKKTPPQIVLRYQMDRGVAVIPKSTNKSRLAENFNIQDFKLSTKDIVVIDSFNKDERLIKLEQYKEHRYYPFK